MDVVYLGALYVLLAFIYSLVMYVFVIPYLTAKKLKSSINSVFGKEVIRDIIIQAMQSLNDEIEIKNPDGSSTKTTVGSMVSSVFVASLANNLKMRFLGEKGLLSKELGAVEQEAILSALPQQYAPIAAQFLPLMKKYPTLGALAGLFMQQRMNGSPPSSAGASSYSAPSNHFYGGI